MRKDLFDGILRRTYPRAGGFSMVEMIIVIVLVGIVFGIGGMLLTRVFNSYFAEQNISSADWQAKLALERATRELRAVRNSTGVPTTVDLDIASATQFRFMDTEGNGVCFYRDAVNNRLMRSADGPATVCGTTSPQPLADNITALSFSYWNNAGAATAVTASVYYVAMAVSVVKGDYTGGFRTNVRPRNF